MQATTYKHLFPEVRNSESFRDLQMGMISDINRKTLPEIAKVVGTENHQGLHHFSSESPWKVVTEANAPERLGAAVGLMEAALELSELKIIWVDSGYSEPNLTRLVETICGAKVVVVKRTQPGFEVLPKRWVVEHTFGWFNRYCRLSKDYELLPEEMK